MFFRPCAPLVLALVVSACASSSDTPSGERSATAARVARGTSTLIIRAELDRFPGQSAYDVIESLHSSWIRPRRVGRGQTFARIMVDGTVPGELRDLRRLYSDIIETIRFVSGPDATFKYGIDYQGGVIEVVTKRGRTGR